MAEEPTGLNLSLDDIIKKQQDQATRGGDERRNRTRGQRQGNFNDGSRRGGDVDMDGGGGGGPVRRHNDGGRGNYNRPHRDGGGSDRLAGRLRDTSGHDPRSNTHAHGNTHRNTRGQIDYREFQRCYVENESGIVVFKYRGGHLVRISPEGEITLNANGFHNETNLKSLNDALNCIGIKITVPNGDVSSGEWSISDGKSLTRYSDGVVIPAKGAAWRGQQVLENFKNPNKGGMPMPPNPMAAANMGMMPGFMPMPGMHPGMHPAMMYGGGRAGETNITEANVGQGDQAELAVYNIIEGLYSPEELVNLTSVNSILGMLKSQDYVIKAFKDANGDLYLEGITENNVVKVLEVKKTCNGWSYHVDSALLPASTDSQIFSRYGDGAIVAQLYANGSSCVLDVPQHVAANVPDTEQWQLVWNTTKMSVPLSNKKLAATILVPQDLTSPGSIKFSAQDSTAAAVMYNMISGEFCPEELESLAGANGGSITKNSLLGEVTGTDLPLKFTNESGTLVVSGWNASARVLSHSVGCQSVLLKTDVPLRPPPSTAATPAPTVLPTPLTRHLTCNPVVYFNDASPTPSSPPSSVSSSNTNLAVGLGVGLGCAAILAAGIGFMMYQKRKKSTNYYHMSSRSGGTTNTNLDSSTWNSVPASSVFASLVTNPTATAATLLGNSHNTTRVAPIIPENATGTLLADLDLEDYEDIEDDGEMFSEDSSIPQHDSIRSKSSSEANTQQLSRLRSCEMSKDLWEIKDTDIQIIVDGDANPVELGCGYFGANVLLTDTMTAKVADVGIAAIHSQGYLTASAGHVIGTLAWSAPELLLGKRCTEKVDVYSLGIVLWEIATGEVPQRGFTQPPAPCERCPAELSQLIRSLTLPNPKNRPTAREAYERILSIPPLEEP